MKYLLLFFALFHFFNPLFAVVEVGKPAPEIELPTSDGKTIKLSDYKGKIVLVDFWASWCGPCREANEEVIEVFNEYNKIGFEILSISLDRKKEYWQRAIRDDKLPWKGHVCDLREWNSPAVINYAVEALPSTFLVDEHGIVIAIDVDYYDLKKLLKKHYNQTKVFPRVTANQVCISTESKLELYNDNGKLEIKHQGENLDMTNFKAGDYMLKLEGKEFHIQKIAPVKNPIYILNEKIMNENESKIEFYSVHGTVLFSSTSKEILLKEILETECKYLICNQYVLKIK